MDLNTVGSKNSSPDFELSFGRLWYLEHTCILDERETPRILRPVIMPLNGKQPSCLRLRIFVIEVRSANVDRHWAKVFMW